MDFEHEQSVEGTYEADVRENGLRAFERGPLAHTPDDSPETVGDLVASLSRMFPASDAESWDRTGLLAGDASWPLSGVAVALDPTFEALEKAGHYGANVLLTHHPAFLEAPSCIAPVSSGASVGGALVFEAVRSGIALVNYHTTLDVSAQAQRMLPGLLGLERVGVLEPLSYDGDRGYGQVCVLSRERRAHDASKPRASLHVGFRSCPSGLGRYGQRSVSHRHVDGIGGGRLRALPCARNRRAGVWGSEIPCGP